MSANILLIEGKRSDGPSFLAGLVKKGFRVDSVPSGNAALRHLLSNRPSVVVVNAASMRTSGKRICQSIRQAAPGVPVILILDQNADKGERVDAEVTLNLPFTLQKLINRIRPLLPLEKKDVLRSGDVQLDVEQRLVICNGRQTRLTPRLVTLLQVLMENPGAVIEREALFRRVWDTEYAGDTRTLDVHISWLREAIEEDPRHPRYLKTVRGVGYRLDISSEMPTRPLPPLAHEVAVS